MARRRGRDLSDLRGKIVPARFFDEVQRLLRTIARRRKK